MKKSINIIFAITTLISNISFAQTANTLPSTGYAGIGTTNPSGIAAFTIIGVANQYACDNKPLFEIDGVQSQTCVKDLALVRTWASIFGPLRTEFVIKNTGFVGIGTATPTRTLDVAGNAAISGTLRLGATAANGTFANYRLSVDGDIVAKRVVVQTNSWADKVFDKNYKLQSLMDVENYVKENCHLPLIPSEKEVIEQGIDVSEMNKLLLQKIEELTLYLIEMKKENQNIQVQLTNLKNN